MRYLPFLLLVGLGGCAPGGVDWIFVLVLSFFTSIAFISILGWGFVNAVEGRKEYCEEGYEQFCREHVDPKVDSAVNSARRGLGGSSKPSDQDEMEELKERQKREKDQLNALKGDKPARKRIEQLEKELRELREKMDDTD